MRKRRAILHIGTAKTGTTTIQRMLLENRQALPARGFCFPSSPGEKNHTRLAIAVAPERRGDKMAKTTREAGDAAYVADRFAADLAAEMAALPHDVHTCIFSNEHCYRKVDTADAARRLKALLDPHFDEYRVVVYLRRQDEMAVSVYSTRLRSGAAHESVLPAVEGNDVYLRRFDWHSLVERWAEAFGREAVRPRLFGRENFVGGDLLDDFFAVCDLDPAGLARPEVKNSALSAPAQEFLRRLNITMYGEAGADDDKAPQFVRQYVDAHHAGRGRRPARAEAEAFMAHFAPSNEALRQGWFPGHDRIFSADFSRYPEVADPMPGDAEVLQVALGLIAQQGSAVPEQQASSAYERAMKRVQAGKAEEARPLLARTLAKEPGHLGALEALLSMAATETDRAEAAARLSRALRAEPGQPELLRMAAAHGVPIPMPAERGERQRAPRAERATAGEQAAVAAPSEPAPQPPRRPADALAERERRKAERREERRRSRQAGVSG